MVAAVLDRDEGAGAVLRDWRRIDRHVPRARIELGGVGYQAIHLGHGGELLAFDIGSTPGDQQARLRICAARAADRLPRLADGFAGDGAAVDDHHVALLRQHRPDLLALGDIEPAAERDDLRFAHA